METLIVQVLFFRLAFLDMGRFQIQNCPPLLIGDEMGISQCHSDAFMAKQFFDYQDRFSLNGKPCPKGMP
jgi:hypothetical protein